MSGRWRVEPRGTVRHGRPWLVLRGAEREAVLWNGPVLELGDARHAPPRPGHPRATRPTSTRSPRGSAPRPGRELGDALLDQRLVAGIGNVWKAESLWRAQVSPWRRVGDTTDDELRETLGHAAALMRESVEGGRPTRHVYRKAGRPCPRCGEPIRSRGQGDDNRTAYWCAGCQR